MTLDGSRSPEVAQIENQTLAEAVVPPSDQAFAHLHNFEEELRVQLEDIAQSGVDSGASAAPDAAAQR
jgi:hypothetical protein